MKLTKKINDLSDCCEREAGHCEKVFKKCHSLISRENLRNQSSKHALSWSYGYKTQREYLLPWIWWKRRSFYDCINQNCLPKWAHARRRQPVNFGIIYYFAPAAWNLNFRIHLLPSWTSPSSVSPTENVGPRESPSGSRNNSPAAQIFNEVPAVLQKRPIPKDHFVKDRPTDTPYDTKQGFCVFLDFVTGLDTSINGIRMVAGLYTDIQVGAVCNLIRPSSNFLCRHRSGVERLLGA